MKALRIFRRPYFSSYKNNTEIYYMGGLDKKGKKTSGIYKLKDDLSGWTKTSYQLPFAVGGKNNQVFEAEKEFCEKP